MNEPTPTTILKLSLLILSVFIISSASQAHAQWLQQTSHTTARLRGISAASSTVAWASGSGRTVLRTTDGGNTWIARPVPGAESLDFRDVEAFDADTAYILSIGEGEKSRIYKTTDGGKTWTLQFTNRNPKAFFDAFAFWDRDNGIAISDPVDGRFLLVRTTDGGASWTPLPETAMPLAVPNEGAFAASGTCITVLGDNVWFATGGSAARVFHSSDRGKTWNVADTPVLRGDPPAGIFSIAFSDQRNGVIVGGNYKAEKDPLDNAAVTNDGGRLWKLIPPGSRPTGYRSAVAYVPGTGGRQLIAVGPSGTDYSKDGGQTWTRLGGDGFDAISFARNGSAAWATGDAGRIAKYAAR